MCFFSPPKPPPMPELPPVQPLPEPPDLGNAETASRVRSTRDRTRAQLALASSRANNVRNVGGALGLDNSGLKTVTGN